PMTKTILPCFAFLLFYINASAQNDTSGVKTMPADTIIVDTMKALTVPTYNIQEAPVKKQPVYKLKPIVDIPITVIGTSWSLYAFSKIYSKPKSDEEKILSLDRNNVNAFDRGAIRPLS